MVVRLAVVSIVFAFALGLSAPAGAQMHGGQPAQGPHPPQAAAMMGAEQMMRHADASMANLTTMMQHLNEMHAAMPGGTQHEQMMGSLQSMTEHMRQMHDTLGTMMHDPALHQHHEAMQAFEQSCRSFDQMSTAFAGMMKNMTRVMQGLNANPKK